MGVGGEATSYDGEKAWSSKNHLILSGIGPHAEVRAHAKSSEEGHAEQVFSVLPILRAAVLGRIGIGLQCTQRKPLYYIGCCVERLD
jgi:hypothetical protein